MQATSFLGAKVQQASVRLPAQARQSVVVYAGHVQEALREKRHKRIRNKVSGTAERPRLAFNRSNQHIYVQVIDDVAGHTLASASTVVKDLREQHKSPNMEAAVAVGKAIAEACKAKGIEKVTFDRAGYRYHGRVQALADAAREGGLQF